MGTPAPAPINVFLDSDGPIADFDKALQASGANTEDFKFWPGVYLWLSLTPGAVDAIARLKELDDANALRVWVATKTPSHSPYAYTEKVLFYRRHFPWLEDRVVLTHDKSLLGGPHDLLLDDRPHKANARHFKGTLVVFDVTTPLDSWATFMAIVERRAAALDNI